MALWWHSLPHLKPPQGICQLRQGRGFKSKSHPGPAFFSISISLSIPGCHHSLSAFCHFSFKACISVVGSPLLPVSWLMVCRGCFPARLVVGLMALWWHPTWRKIGITQPICSMLCTCLFACLLRKPSLLQVPLSCSLPVANSVSWHGKLPIAVVASNQLLFWGVEP